MYIWLFNAVICRCANFISFVASQYARSTNKKLNRSGHLFERRHRAILVQPIAYLKELIRYIHLNPLRPDWSMRCRTMSGVVMRPTFPEKLPTG